MPITAASATAQQHASGEVVAEHVSVQTVLDGAMDADSETPRELVAEVIVESVGRGEAFNRNPIDFEGGNGAVAEI